MRSRSYGPPRQIRSSLKSSDFVNVFTGQHTSTHAQTIPADHASTSVTDTLAVERPAALYLFFFDKLP
jgi:hypothetical protein